MPFPGIENQSKIIHIRGGSGFEQEIDTNDWCEGLGFVWGSMQEIEARD
jgi:hypothetical protein